MREMQEAPQYAIEPVLTPPKELSPEEYLEQLKGPEDYFAQLKAQDEDMDTGPSTNVSTAASTSATTGKQSPVKTPEKEELKESDYWKNRDEGKSSPEKQLFNFKSLIKTNRVQSDVQQFNF